MTSLSNNGGEPIKSALTLKYNLALLGSPPLIPGDDARAYDQLLSIVTGIVKPDDLVDLILTREFVDEEWEILRYRRAAANLIKAATVTALAVPLRQALLSNAAFNPVLDRTPERLASKWTKGDAAAIAEVRTILDSTQPTEDENIAQAISLKLSDLERLDRMIMTKEARRDNTLREIDRRRASLGGRLRRAAEQIQDAEFSPVDENSAEGEYSEEKQAS